MEEALEGGGAAGALGVQAQEPLPVGAIVSESLNIMLRNWAIVLPVSLAVMAPALVASQYFHFGESLPLASSSFFVRTGARFLSNSPEFLCGCLLQAILADTTLRDLKGERLPRISFPQAKRWAAAAVAARRAEAAAAATNRTQPPIAGRPRLP